MIIIEAKTANIVLPDPKLRYSVKHFSGIDRTLDIGERRLFNPTESHRIAAADSTIGSVLQVDRKIDISEKSLADSSFSDTLQTVRVLSSQSRKREGTANIQSTLQAETMHSIAENDIEGPLYNSINEGKRARSESDDEPAAKNGKTSTARSLPAAQKNPASVARRNARERRRIKNVNLAFDELREHVPSDEKNKKKISKVRSQVPQLYIDYIH